MNKRTSFNRSTQTRRQDVPQGDLQAVMALRALRLPGAPAYPGATVDESLPGVDVVCPYCGRESLVSRTADFGDGLLAEGVCSICGTRTLCYSAPQEALRLPWLIAAEMLA